MGIFFHGLTKQRRAQITKIMRKIDGRLTDVSIRRSCHGFYISDGVHPFGSNGHLARYAQRPDCGWTLFKHDRLGKTAGAVPDHTPCAWSSPRKSESSSWKTMRKRAPICARKLTTQRRMLCFSSSAL